MTTIINRLLGILENMSGVQTVMYDNSNSANVRIDRKPTPAALVYTLPDWKVDISHGSARESCEIQVFFFNRVDFDSKAESKLETFENMGEIAREFIYRLLNESTIRVLDDTIKITATYGSFDSFVAGCTVQITIEEKQGSCMYVENEPTPEHDENSQEEVQNP